MVEGGGGAVFPVKFYDGEKEILIGNVRINPGLDYKPFQHMLSNMIGISPNQISSYIVDQTTYPNSNERRKLPITGKVNFGAICNLKGIHFLAVLKRSRKSRNRRDRPVNHAMEFDEYGPQTPMSAMPENMVLLRRNQPIVPYYDQISPLVDLNGRLQNSRFYRDNLQMSMAENGYPVYDPTRRMSIDSFPPLDEIYQVPGQRDVNMMTKSEAVQAPSACADCFKEKFQQDTSSFHHCVNDPVIRRVINRVGPIARPSQWD